MWKLGSPVSTHKITILQGAASKRKLKNEETNERQMREMKRHRDELRQIAQPEHTEIDMCDGNQNLADIKQGAQQDTTVDMPQDNTDDMNGQ